MKGFKNKALLSFCAGLRVYPPDPDGSAQFQCHVGSIRRLYFDVLPPVSAYLLIIGPHEIKTQKDTNGFSGGKVGGLLRRKPEPESDDAGEGHPLSKKKE